MYTQDWEKWLVENLACPRDYQKLELVGDCLICPEVHVYPLVDDIPVMLIDDVQPTQNKEFQNSLEVAKTYIKTNQVKTNILLSEKLSQSKCQTIDSIDIFVQEAISATGGNLYKALIGKLTCYPVNFILKT